MEVGADPPHLRDLVDDFGREILEDPVGNMMISEDEWGAKVESGALISPYMDGVLKGDPSKYQPSPSLAGGIPLLIAYADNLNVAGTCPSQVQAAKDGAVQRLRALGFGVHEETAQVTEVAGIARQKESWRFKASPRAPTTANTLKGNRATTRKSLQAGSKDEKSVKRQALRTNASQPRFPGRTFLEQVAVSHEVALDYQKRMSKFMSFVKKEKLSTRRPEKLDESLSAYLNSIFLEEGDISEGSKSFAAVLDARPDCSHKSLLPRSRRCLKGWANLSGGHAAAALSIQAQDVVRPTKTVRSFAINLHPAERLESSKTGMSDEAILLDSLTLPQLGPMLGRLAKARGRGQLFSVKYANLRLHWEEALKAVGLTKNFAVLYQLRHSGPSHDRLHKLRTSLEVKLRGRWEADSSVKFYEAHSKLGQEFQQLPEEVLLPNVKQGAFKWVIELFSGSGHLSRACCDAGFAVLSYDIRFGPGCDLLRTSVQSKLFKFLRSADCALVWIGMPGALQQGANICFCKAQMPAAFQASLELNVKLGRAGISLIDEGPPKPRELFFFSLDMLRLEYLQDAARDAEKITMSISEVQAICQLPGRSDGKDKVNMLDLNRLQHLPNALLQNQELPAVVLANHSAGGKSFLQFHMIRQATSSRDLCVSSSQLDVDKLDFTLDEMWLTPLKQWLSDLGGGGLDVFGSTAEDLLSTAGKPITDGYVAPDVPAVVQAEQVKIGGLDTTVWCSLRLKYLDFLPVYVRAALKVLSFSSFFTLDGVSLVLPARQLEPHRGSLQDYATTIGSQYAYSVLDHIASLLGKSSLLNLPKAPLKLGGAAVALVGDNLKGVTDGAVSMLRNLTLDDEYIARKNRAPKGPIQGAGQGFSAAGKSLWEGVEGMLDVVNKPMEGAKKDGLWGFATGLTKGAMGTIVKPVAAIGTAIGEVGSGLASTTNQLNENEAIQRRRATRRLRLPRLLFGELGEVRPYMNIDALLLQRYGESLSGVCEVVSLEPGGDGKAKSVLLLFSDKLAVASASAEAPEAPSRLERGFPPLKSNKQGAPLRGLHFSELREVSQEGTALNLHTIQGQKYPLELKQAWLPEGAVQALVEGLSAGARHKRLEAHRTWADLRSILRGEAHAARKRDMRMVAETGLKMHPSEDMLKDRGAARSRLLEVFEVERHQFGWGAAAEGSSPLGRGQLCARGRVGSGAVVHRCDRAHRR
ncbi:unnamed protein product [Effrenium voratum]|nr:unnamed protein product [Effrenium voratum]